MIKRVIHDRRRVRDPLMATAPSTWHRIRDVREREDVSLNTLSRRARISLSQLKMLEEMSDPPVSLLYRVAKGLGVPVSDLLVDQQAQLSEPIRQRACLVRIARTAHTLLQKSKDKTTRYLSQTLVNELHELMPELDNLGTWPEVGQRRPPTDVPRVMERMVAEVPVPRGDGGQCWFYQARHDE